jgi:ABC-type sugar transport system permease subunit
VLRLVMGSGPKRAVDLDCEMRPHAFVPPINFGMATAASALLFLILLVLTLVNLLIGRRRGAT